MYFLYFCRNHYIFYLYFSYISNLYRKKIIKDDWRFAFHRHTYHEIWKLVHGVLISGKNHEEILMFFLVRTVSSRSLQIGLLRLDDGEKILRRKSDSSPGETTNKGLSVVFDMFKAINKITDRIFSKKTHLPSFVRNMF